MEELWKMLVYLYNTHLFCATRYTCSLAYSRLPPPPHKAHSYIQTAWGEGERGSSKGERKTANDRVIKTELQKTADDRVIKTELHPPHRAGRQATVHPSRLLLMAWASKNLRLLSHPVRIHPCYCNNVGD